MNYELFIAKRIIAAKQYKSSISSPIIKIAISAIAIGIIVMMIAIATGFGLQEKIREKLSGFNGHIQITNFDNNNSEITLNPVSKNQDFYPEFTTITNIENVQVFATKGGIIRTESDFEGIILKGVAKDYNWTFFNEYLVEGTIPDFNNDVTNDVLISKEISNRLHINLGDTFNILFVKDDPSKAPWLRVVKAVGIYNSGFQEFDENFVIANIRHIQKMNRWTEDQVGGFEVLITNFDEIGLKSSQIYKETASTLNSQSIIEKYPGIFEWISLFDNNIYLIIVIMILVAGINMITALLVLILERTQMIGILKALGSTDVSIRKVFLYNAGYLVLKGLFWGNLIGLTILLAQKYGGFITLNPETYYVSEAPVYIDFWYILLLNICTLLLCLLMLIVPTLLIAKIDPVKSIKFE
ncbi:MULTISPECIES: ABC transporter permease [Flavobacteriaceae]|uniref:ABC transporter permease n=2 Tax=Flavobacteriaceae TaxID=49546 RepID=A0A4Y8AXQ9_9FLAO|nr:MULTISPECIES: FtsX-like permease family protein [Flavobacteriaceae]TEW76895.1 ABC transporter permease [Gramella jeungdoensis]GGK49187.1 permease [Lutibacter litoralis]